MHKPHLKNLLTKEKGLAKLAAEDFGRVTVSFYRYVRINDPRGLRDELFTAWNKLGVLGRIYLSHEGVNAQCSIPEHNWEGFKEHLQSYPMFEKMPFKIGVLQSPDSFWKLMIKVKKQIVADGLTIDDYDIENVGTHLDAEEFNEAMDDPETVVVDMRNHYESEIGHFQGAWCPDVDTFRDQLPLVAERLEDKKDKKVLLYCTGGIRCEKASAYLKHHGFQDVNQLHGGIIAYAHQVREGGLDCKFRGANYVFDGRTRESISGETISECHQCGASCDFHTNCSNPACNLLFIQCEECRTEMNGACTKQCKKISHWPEDKQKAYVKKHGHMTQEKFSKALRPKEMLGRKGWWGRLVSRLRS